VQIEALPSVLVLHLKRFLYDATADGEVKISKHVQFAPELEIPLGTVLLFISPPCWPRLKFPCGLVYPEIMTPVTGRSAESAHYKLYGVLYHHGGSTHGGHYTVDVLHQNGDNGSGETWLHIDDAAVSTVRHEDVFGDDNNEQVDDRCAHMLFYCHVSPTQTQCSM
jgi:ubiquitin carboxyl-terminal hydrolase 10